MNEEIEKLKLEIDVLKKRVEELENIHRRQKIFKIIKLVIGIVIIIGIVIAGIYLYQMLKSYYDNLNNMISNPFSNFDIDSFTKIPLF